ncbi:MAG TPA: hypothetical protein VI754_07265 [Bacteriovoracaceae bacterium]|nr:hypothetical protein [Bacteriovoracaceae bacterium]
MLLQSIRDNIVGISATKLANDSISVFGPELNGVQAILLGEPDHGSGAAFAAKVQS